MSVPKISIIIPVYNSEQYLTRCVHSITAQTLSDLEIILVDDGSKEPCAQLCDALAQEDSRIKVIHKSNAGPGFARNSGLDAASGEYIGFVDSDDDIDHTMYETLYAAAETHDADLVLSGVCFVGGNTVGNPDETVPKNYFDKDTVFEGDTVKHLLLGVAGALPHEPDDSRYGVGVWKNIFRRELIENENIRFLSQRKYLSEDTLFMVDVIKHITKAVGIPGAFYHYWRNDDSLSKSYKSDRFDQFLVFISELESHIKDTVAKDEYQIYLDRLTQSYARVLCSQEIMHAVDHNIRYPVLRSRLKAICTHAAVKSVLQSYPWHRLPKKQAAFAFAMKYQLYILQIIMVRLRAR